MKLILLLILPSILLLLGHSLAAERSSRNDAVPMVQIEVKIDLKNHVVRGRVSAVIPAVRRFEFCLADLDIKGITLGGHDIMGAVGPDRMLAVGPINSSRKLLIEFSRHISPDSAMGEAGNFMGDDAAVLLENWHPRLTGLARYHLRAVVPSGLEAVSEADSITRREKNGEVEFSFDFPWPREEVTLVAGRYTVRTTVHNGIELAGYFFPEDQALADGYVEKLRYYLDLYADLLPPYPFKRFAVVENILPTGFGMPTYTLLGRQVVKLPFIVDTSLGHEFVHSWFGNSVYVATDQGNWCEGITTYLADALYQEIAGSGAEYRHRALIEYQAWVHGDRAISISDFRTRKDRAARAVGYGKTAMLFHMLEKETGSKVFRNAIWRFASEYCFRYASWKDIQEIFQEEYGHDLGWFFEQWLSRRDVPDLEFSKVLVDDAAGGAKQLKFTVVQKTERPYRLTLPLEIIASGDNIFRNIEISDGKTEVTMKVPEKFYSIVADPDFDLMRKLSPPEYPPVLARVFGSEKKFFMVTDGERKKYDVLVNFFVSRGFVEKKPGGHGHGDYREGAFVILGSVSGGMKMLAGDCSPPETGVEIVVRQGPLGRDSVICVIQASSSEELKGIASKLPHYGRYSRLRFSGGKLDARSTAPAVNGLQLEVRRGIMAIASKDIFPVKKIVRYISGDRVVYVSEKHDEAGHHSAQLKIIELLDKRGVTLAVGMEMFQRPFQQVLDRYLAGETDERTFLRESEYFRRWGFDYHLYRPVVEYCRSNHIPVIALNLPKEVSAKIARKGLDGLSDQEKARLPADIDDSDRRYRRHLQDIFRQHSQSGIDKFEYFFQAQLSWDETMAETAADYLKSHKDTTLVVIAGSGHIAYGFGIPSRVERRLPGVEYSIIVNDPGDDMTPEAADFFLFPPEEKVEKAPKLGVVLTDANATLEIKQVMPGSPAEKGGVKAGDVLVMFDGHPVHDINDLKLELFFKKLGEKAKLTVKREEKTVELETGPLNSSSFSFGSPHGAGMKSNMMKQEMMHKKP